MIRLDLSLIARTTDDGGFGIGSRNNRNFAGILSCMFVEMNGCRRALADITVTGREEGYTSRAPSWVPYSSWTPKRQASAGIRDGNDQEW
jgi:hypothetical protein